MEETRKFRYQMVRVRGGLGIMKLENKRKTGEQISTRERNDEKVQQKGFKHIRKGLGSERKRQNGRRNEEITKEEEGRMIEGKETKRLEKTGK